MTPAELLAVPGVSECTLPAELADSLPASAPAPPWDVSGTALVWCGRPGRAAARVSAAAPARPLLVVGGFIEYADTPVGTYAEVFGAVGLRAGRTLFGTVPLMAVDSCPSVVAGRQNWSLPKCLVEFRGSLASGEISAVHGSWRVRATVAPFGPRFPLRLAGRMVQLWPDGVRRAARLRGRGRARLAIVTVDVRSSGTLPSWLRPGRHLGATVTGMRFSLSAAAP